jgi:methyltransferase (TIGR00027 family)
MHGLGRATMRAFRDEAALLTRVVSRVKMDTPHATWPTGSEYLVRLLAFIFIELWLFPWQVLAIIGYTAKVWWKTSPAKISGTANEIVTARLLMHTAGTRPDQPTARLVPHLPAFGTVIAWLFGSIGLASRWSGYKPSWTEFPVTLPSVMNSMVGHRTGFFDRVLADAIDPKGRHPVKQIVILGAGWDTRAWGLLADANARIFELDMPPTQSAKRAALEGAGLPADRVTFVETDFAAKTWLQAIVERGFDQALPTFFLWEGVTMYLSSEAVDAILDGVGRLAPGSRIAFDFLSRELLHAETPFEKLGKLTKGAMKFYSNEPWRYGISTKPPVREHVERIVAAHGLELADYEPFGPEDEAFGGVTVAVRRS